MRIINNGLLLGVGNERAVSAVGSHVQNQFHQCSMLYRSGPLDLCMCLLILSLGNLRWNLGRHTSRDPHYPQIVPEMFLSPS